MSANQYNKESEQSIYTNHKMNPSRWGHWSMNKFNKKLLHCNSFWFRLLTRFLSIYHLTHTEWLLMFVRFTTLSLGQLYKSSGVAKEVYGTDWESHPGLPLTMQPSQNFRLWFGTLLSHVNWDTKSFSPDKRLKTTERTKQRVNGPGCFVEHTKLGQLLWWIGKDDTI